MAIPKGGYFQDKVEQGRYGPIFPKTPASYGFRLSRKSSRGARTSSTNTPKASRDDRGPAGRPGRLAAALPALGALSIKGDTYFMYQGIFDTDFDKYTEAPLRYSKSRVCGQCLKMWRVSRRTGSQIPPPSSSLSAIINARASSNTRNILLLAPLKSRRRSS